MSSQKQSHRYVNLVEKTDEQAETIANLYERVEALEERLNRKWWKPWTWKKERVIE